MRSKNEVFSSDYRLIAWIIEMDGDRKTTQTILKNISRF
jgi:hypothetical protein